jgi:hypothetical protein
MSRGTVQRYLEFGLSLPVGASDLVLRRRLAAWNGEMSSKTLATRMSELRLLTDRNVRRHLEAIRHHVDDQMVPDAKYKHTFMSACVRVRRDGIGAL